MGKKTEEVRFPKLTDAQAFAVADGLSAQAVALVDGQGKHAGTLDNAIHVRTTSEPLIAEMVTQLRILNRYMSEIVGTEITAEDL